MPLTGSKTGLTAIENRFEEQEQLGADSEQLLKWLDFEVAVSGGLKTFEPAAMPWILDKFDVLLG